MARSFLITVSGPERPGLGARILEVLGALEEHGASLLDVAQISVRGHVVLCAELSLERPDARDLLHQSLAGEELETLGASVRVEAVTDAGAPRSERLQVTLLGPRIRASDLARVVSTLGSAGAICERVTHLGSSPVDCYELEVRGGESGGLRAALGEATGELGLDVAVQRAGLHRRGTHLVVMDADSTLLQDEVIDLLAAAGGRDEEVSAITAAAMAGELDFAESLRRRVGLLAGLEASVLDDVRARLRLTPGARTLLRTLHRLGHASAVVSGGFVEVLAPLLAELNVRYLAANHLEIVDGRLTGALVGPIVDRAGKAAALRRFAAEAGVGLEQTVAVGDGANDIDMITAAGLGIAFNAKAALREAADVSLSVPYLDSVLFFLGISRDEVEAD